MVKVAIIGATGYTGRELISILSGYPEAEINSLSAKINSPLPISDIFPVFKGIMDIDCYPFEPKVKEQIRKSDYVFLAVPHGISLELVHDFLDQGKKVIDLSADYRLEKEEYEHWYGREHPHPELLEKAVYGLTEFNREKIKGADLIANPGCFPTGILLALLPVVNQGVINLNNPIVIDSKTGASGAGRKASLDLNFSELDQDIKPYKVNRHQHSVEIVRYIEKFSSIKANIIFVPHLVAIKRGILNTIYISLKHAISLEKLMNVFLEQYKKSKFIKIFNSAERISLLDVVNTNKCHIGITIDESKKQLIITSALDNLGKGAAGQAVQNMNAMCGFDESLGLM